MSTPAGPALLPAVPVAPGSPPAAPARVSSRPLARLALRRLRQRPLPYLLCLLGIALGVAMLVSIDLASGSAQRAFALSTDAITGRTTHRLVAVAPAGVPEATYVALRREFPQLPAAPVIEGYARSPELGDGLLRLVGVDLFAEAPFRDTLGGGALSGPGFVPFLTEPATGVIAADRAGRGGVAAGDTVHLERAGRSESLRVVGTVGSDRPLERRSLDDLVLLDLGTAQELLDMPGHLGWIDLIVDDPATLDALRQWLPEGLRIDPAAAKGNAVQRMTEAFELNLTAMSLLATVVGMFLIYNTVTFSVVQRRDLFGRLRCLGVTRGQLFGLILGEAAVVSLVGSLLGLALGLGMGHAIVGLITRTINDLYFVVSVRQITLSPLTLAKGMAVGVASSLVASAVPAWEAMDTPPQLALKRSSLEGGWKRRLPWFLVAAVLAGGGAALLLAWPGGRLLPAFAGLFLMLMAAALAVPPLLDGLMGALAVPAGALGVVVRLAPRDIRRSLSRTAVAVAALMVAVSVTVGIAIMIGSFRATVVTWLEQTLQADLYVSPPGTAANRILGRLDPAVVEEIRGLPELRRVVSYDDFDVRLPELDRQVTMVAAGGDVSSGHRPYAWIRPDLDDPWAAMEEHRGVIISEALQWRGSGGSIPESLAIETPQGVRRFDVLAVYYDYASDRGTVLIDAALAAQVWQESGVASLGLFTAPGIDPEAVAAEIRGRFQARQELLVRSNVALREASLEVFDRTFAITGALQLLAVVVAFIGILSTLMSLQLERSREFALLRAIGMTPAQLGRLTLLETGLMGLVAGTFALPLGAGLAWVLVHVINVRSFGWSLQLSLDPRCFGQSLLIAVGAALLAGVLPALRQGRGAIATALREE